MSELLTKAKELAKGAYGRKEWHNGVELALHVDQVVNVHTNYFSSNINIAAAAWLHEIHLAEKPVSLDDISAAVSPYVASLVWALQPGIPWEESLQRFKGVNGAAQLKYCERLARVAYGGTREYIKGYADFTSQLGRQVRRDTGDAQHSNNLRSAYELLVNSHETPSRLWGWWVTVITNYNAQFATKNKPSEMKYQFKTATGRIPRPRITPPTVPEIAADWQSDYTMEFVDRIQSVVIPNEIWGSDSPTVSSVVTTS